MVYEIVHETSSRMRIRIEGGRLSRMEAWLIQYLFLQLENVEQVEVYRATAGCAIRCRGSHQKLVKQLDAFQFEAMRAYARRLEKSAGSAAFPTGGEIPFMQKGKADTECLFQEAQQDIFPVSGRSGAQEKAIAEAFAKEMQESSCRRRKKTQVVLEAIADIVLPQPLQVGYHVLQMLAF